MLGLDDLLEYDYNIEIDAHRPNLLHYFDLTDQHEGFVEYNEDELQRLKRFAKQILALALPIDG